MGEKNGGTLVGPLLVWVAVYLHPLASPQLPKLCFIDDTPRQPYLGFMRVSIDDGLLISSFRDSALEIMREPEAKAVADAGPRADRLELAARYLCCAAILNGELEWSACRL